MEHYRASDGDTGGFDERQVQASHGYVGIYSIRWGTPLPGQPELSYAVQEFEAASAAGLPPAISARKVRNRVRLVSVGSSCARAESHADRRRRARSLLWRSAT